MENVQGKVDSRAMREINRSIVLDIIRKGGRISRTDLARRSALTKPTVSAIVEDLLARGIVQEVGYGKAVGSGGRRARLLEFNDASAAYLGFRFGVSTTSVGVADARGELKPSARLRVWYRFQVRAQFPARTQKHTSTHFALLLAPSRG